MQYYVTMIPIFALVIITLTFHPWMSRKNVIFGVVFGNEDIWNTSEAKKLRVNFAFYVGVISFLLSAGIIYLETVYGENSILSLTLIWAFTVCLILPAIAYIICYNAAKKLKADMPQDSQLKSKISVEVGTSESKQIEPLSTLWILIFIPIIIITALIAIYFYDKMPNILPMHYNSKMQVDSAVPKSWNTVFFPIYMQVIMSALMSVIFLAVRRAPGAVRGNPNAEPNYPVFRRKLSGVLLCVGVLTTLLFTIIELSYIKNLSGISNLIPIMPAIILIPCILVFYYYFKYSRKQKATGTILDDDSKWKLGMFYVNPKDPAIFVEKRVGIGTTLNLGHPLAWLVIVGLIAIIVFSTMMKHAK